MSRRCIATVQHHVRVADGRQIAGTIHQQKRNMQAGFEQAMDEPSDWVGLLRVDQDATGKSGIPA